MPKACEHGLSLSECFTCASPKRGAECEHGALRRSCDRCEMADELTRLHAEVEALRGAYQKMRNAAAGYSNYCIENANTRRCERDYTEAENLFRAAIDEAYLDALDLILLDGLPSLRERKR